MIDLSQLLPIAVACGFVVGIGLIVWEICVGKHFHRVPLWVLTLLILVFVPVTLLLHQDGRINLPAPVSSSLQLLVAQGTSSAEIVSLNAHDGSQRWQRTLNVDSANGLVNQSFTLSGSTIYGVVSDQAHPGSTAYALNGPSGAVLWKTHLAPQSPYSLATAPVVADGLVYLLFYVGSDAASVLALHASDGSQAWSAKLANVQQISRTSTLLAGNGRLFVANMAGDLRALRSSDGSLAWNAQIVNQRPIVQSNTVNLCVLAGDLLYTIAPDKHSVVGLRPGDGQPVWHLDLGNLSIASLNIIHDHLYLSTINSNGEADSLYVFDLQDARLLWKSHLDGCVMPALAESGATVYSTCGSSLSSLRLNDGSQIWTKSNSGTYSLYGRPLLVDGVLFVQTIGFPMRYTRTAAPTIDALSSADGSYYWRYTFPGNSGYNNTGFFLGALEKGSMIR